MKKYLLLLSASFITYLSITGYTTGPANFANINCTGSYGSQASCDGGNCHGPNDANVSVNIIVKDLFGNVVNNSRYFPNAYYKIFVSGYKISGNYPKFNYSFSTSSQNLDDGTITITGNQKATVVGTAEIIEPSLPLNTITTGSTHNFSDSMLWRAPAPGNGQWTLYATALLANDDGTRVGDVANNYQRTLSPTPAAVSGLNANTDVKIFPNPVRNSCNIEISGKADHYELIVYSASGQLLYKGKREVTTDTFKQTIDASSWTTGVYYLEIMNKNKEKKMVSFVKL